MHTRKNIKARTVTLGMSMKELRFLIEKRGIACTMCQLSAAIHSDSRNCPPKFDVLCEAADEILTDLEKQSSAAK